MKIYGTPPHTLVNPNKNGMPTQLFHLSQNHSSNTYISLPSHPMSIPNIPHKFATNIDRSFIIPFKELSTNTRN